MDLLAHSPVAALWSLVILPEVVVALFTGVAAILSAVAAIMSARRSGAVLVKARAIEKSTNGAAAAMEADRKALRDEVNRLKADLVEETARRVLEGLTADRASADVRSAMAATPTQGERAP